MLNDNFLSQLELDTYKTYKLTYSYNTLIPNKGKVLLLEDYGKKRS